MLEPTNRSWSPFATIALGALSFVVLLSTCATGFLLPLTPHRLEKPAASLMDRLPFWQWLAANRPRALDEAWVAAGILIGGTLLAFAACGVAMWITWRLAHRKGLWLIVLGTAIAAAFLNVWSPPNANSNIYNYILRGRLVSVYGVNPYVVPASEFAADVIYPYVSPRNTILPGGKLPAWMMWNAAFTWIAGNDVVRNLLTMRIGLFFFSLANLGLVAYLARRLIPERALAGVLLWCWNPVVILNGQSRTDPVMVCYLLIGMCLLLHERHWQAAVSLTLSVYVKLLTLPLLAVAAVTEVRARRWGRLTKAVIAVVLTSVLVWAPFSSVAGPTSMVGYSDTITGEAAGSSGTSYMGALLRVAFAGLVLAIGWTRNGSTLHLFQGWAVVQLFFSLLFAKFASADYHMTLLAIIAVTMSPRLLVIALAVSFASLLFDEWYRLGSETFVLPDLFPYHPRMMALVPILAGAAILSILALRSRRKGM